MNITTRPGTLMSFDRLPYEEAWELQRRLVEERVADRRPDTLVLLEHEPVFTIGRSGQSAHWGDDQNSLQDAGYSVYHVERGGSVTYHGPGQIVGYPILRLSHFCQGPKGYMQLLEEVLIRTLADWGIAGRRMDKLIGVWIGAATSEKIAAMGVRIAGGVTMHGFALNVNVDLEPFRRIVPCGIAGCRVTSMQSILGKPVDISMVRRRIAEVFSQVFALDWTQWTPADKPIRIQQGPSTSEKAAVVSLNNPH